LTDRCGNGSCKLENAQWDFIGETEDVFLAGGVGVDGIGWAGDKLEADFETTTFA
jgi:hypothetical protein